MASRISFNAVGVPRLNPYIPHAVKADSLVFVSGTAGVDPTTGKLIEGGFEEQAMQAFRNIQTILQEAGSDLSKIVKTTVFMVSGADADFIMINRVYSHFFPAEPPARSAPQVMPFPGNILVSVECIAVL